jgi:hypothetical protein
MHGDGDRNQSPLFSPPSPRWRPPPLQGERAMAVKFALDAAVPADECLPTVLHDTMRYTLGGNLLGLLHLRKRVAVSPCRVAALKKV